MKYSVASCVAAFLAAVGFWANSPRCGSAQAPEKRVYLWLEAEDFQYHGDWVAVREQRWPPSGKEALFAGPKGAALPAVTAVDIPANRTHTV
jgi:hypothetical protein